MKTFFVLSALVSVNFAYPNAEPPGCEFCRKGTGVIFEKFRSDKQIAIFSLVLAGPLCSKFDDPNGCKVGVEKWFPKIAKIIFSDDAAKEVCKGISDGACNAFKESNWNCDTCVKDVGLIANGMMSETGIKDILSVLEGKAFCQDSALGLSPDQVQTCQGYIKDYMPSALKVLMGILMDSRHGICRNYFDGICP